MLRGLVNRLRGQVRLRAECAFPERVLNLCAARDLAFWDLQWESPTAFTCRLTRRDYHRLRRAAEAVDCTLSVVGREGAPYFLARFRGRRVLVVSLTVCAMALFLGSFFVCEFVVEGNETVPTEEILRALEKNGVGIGSFGLALDGEDIRNHVLLDVPELSWLTVNVSGFRAYVQVRERVPAPEVVDEEHPSNVVARRPGMVLEVRAMDGVTAVGRGSVVTEGQLLISGVEDLDTFGARVLTGMGSVTARTWYTLVTHVPLTASLRTETGWERTGFSLVLGTRRVKFFSNSSIAGRSCDKITTRTPLRLLGIPLPVTLVKEVWREYALETAELAETAAQALGEQVLTEYLHSIVDPYGTVQSTLCTARREGDVLTVTLKAECREEIGRQVPIYTEEADG